MGDNRSPSGKPAAPRAGRVAPRRDPSSFAVVGIGASAGGLEACKKLLGALPAHSGMAFILVQHLDPTHESLMVELLAEHTKMTVRQAASGTPIEPDHLYVIPPGTYLAISAGHLQLSQPGERRGARMPFDFLLRALAEESGARAICIILSGSGADGSVGLRAIKEHHGLVIAQDPDEAGFDGMPRSAIGTGHVDLVLRISDIPDALLRYDQRMSRAYAPDAESSPDQPASRLPEIIEILRSRTPHDFTLYKPGTLQRRIERRMAMSAIDIDNIDRYVDVLRGNKKELDLLAKDLLINVTSFFRDPEVFQFLEEYTIPDLVRRQSPDLTLRVWVAGCSTGEETYSLAMLFHEHIVAAKSKIKLQIFASDVDPEAVASAREGLYPETIEADVSPARLAAFFTKDEHGYRISPELRAAVIFTVQDLLADPPFSRIDFVSCRNLLIYLRPEAQMRALSLFHFALREGGVLLLGSAETIGHDDRRFEPIARAKRLYRQVGRSRPGDIGFSVIGGEATRIRTLPEQGQTAARQTALAELTRRLVLENYAPAAVLINRKYECLYSLGPTDRYLRVPPGHPSNDLLAMARLGLRSKLRSAIDRAQQEDTRVTVDGGRRNDSANPGTFSIAVQPVHQSGEELLLICFVDTPEQGLRRRRADPSREASGVLELKQELQAAQADLQSAIRDLEISTEEQKAINEEALSVNEEYQSTNEELLTSKEELQSLNEELTALNSQLQETLERQRTTSNDLQNVLYSTDVATLFLDSDLNIRFFTPATKALFNIIPSDVGRPLADLRSIASDAALLEDAHTVLQTRMPTEREIEAPNNAWFTRRILPYRTHSDSVEGVVITFADITERKHTAKALETAKQQSEQANIAKSRFLAAASHDLRQPLQVLALLQGLLANTVSDAAAQKLVGRLDDTLNTMSGMLNTLLDINQIEAGIIQAEMADFRVNDMFDRLRDEFTYVAEAQGLSLQVMPCGLIIHSDRRLLEQILRNLLSNALKYTRRGRILIGCRRRGGTLDIEIWDTGIGIADAELVAIFDEYHQIDNAARERSRGLGLGLSIVKRLATLLGHTVRVRSKEGRGSVFAVAVTLPPDTTRAWAKNITPVAMDQGVANSGNRDGTILVIEDDLDVRELVEMFLLGAGHRVVTTQDGNAALDIVKSGGFRPDLILADYNLPHHMNGLDLAVQLREMLGREIPVVILTGDISTETLRDCARLNCTQLSKPVTLTELSRIIQLLLPATPSAPILEPTEAADEDGRATVYVVDDDAQVREAIRPALQAAGYRVKTYPTGEAFLTDYHPGVHECIVIDAYLPGMDGIEMLRTLRRAGHAIAAIVITGKSDVPMAVDAMKAGAADFIEKPVRLSDLLASIERSLEFSRDEMKTVAWRESAALQIAGLSPRQRQIMEMVVAGQPSKNIAADLGISQRTVENHRASIMKKTGATSLPALARLALAAAQKVSSDPNTAA